MEMQQSDYFGISQERNLRAHRVGALRHVLDEWRSGRWDETAAAPSAYD
jgi:hypothetical protein